jgi:hypothetical protein
VAKKPSPWFWEARGGWYVLVDGKRHFLGEHPKGARVPRKSRKTGRWNSPPEIDTAFRQLLRGDSPATSGGGHEADKDAVVNLLDDFVTWCEKNRAPKTAARYQDFLQDFVRTTPSGGGLQFGRLPITYVSCRRVSDWLGQRPRWNGTTKRNAITALMRAFNWACKNRGLLTNPIKGMEKPEAKRRDSVVTPAEFNGLLEHVHDRNLMDLLVVSYDSGCRPQEVKQIEARHVQADKCRPCANC